MKFQNFHEFTQTVGLAHGGLDSVLVNERF